MRADDVLILGQRLSAWCGHGPVLEQDIALTNIALDLIGQARAYYQLAAHGSSNGQTEDTLAYLRDAHEFKNHLLVELPNGHWGDTLMRQFLFDTYNFYLLEALTKSSAPELSGLAAKAIKEVSYHAQYSAEWVIRLGDGTEESHSRMQSALDILWPYTDELFEDTSLDVAVHALQVGPLPSALRADWLAKVSEVLQMATLTVPSLDGYHQRGGLHGKHTEHLGILLAEMQFLPRAYPTAQW